MPESQKMEEPEFTGERFIPAKTDPQLALEHYHRYLLASQFVNDKRVLDIACGEGYGTAFLSIMANHVLGVDVDTLTIERARQTYKQYRNAEFRVGRCEDWLA